MSRLADARWPEIVQTPRPVLIVPVGATEQHGPHLPLDTDTVIAQAVADGVQGLRPTAGLAPALAYGASDEHAGFAGTLSIGTDAVSDVLVQLVRHAAADWAAVLIINGHGGNADALGSMAQVCQTEGHRLDVVHCAPTGSDAHAGRSETAMMLHLAPDRVEAELAEPGETTPLPQLLPRLRDEGVRAVSRNGVLGDPTGASAAEGQQLLDGLVEVAVDAFDALPA